MNLLFTHWPITPASQRLVILLFLLGLGRLLPAQCTLSCNQGLQVSLDASGQALITTQLVAPNASASCPGALELKLFNAFGQQIANPLTCANIGQNITAQVRHLASGNFCTSDVEVFDAIGPTVSCPDKFIFCNENPEPSEVGWPTATDNCTPSNSLDFNYLDTETDLGCGVFQNGFPVLKRIDRSWTVTDDQGNSAPCSQRIWLKHIRPTDITYPPNRDNIGAPALVCGDDPTDLTITGEPSVAGIPVGASIDCEIAVTYTDNIINHCLPAAYTVLRTWTTLDFCTSGISTRVQIIKVEDKIAPVLVPPADVTVGTDGFTCSGSLTLPAATATDNCSSVSIVPNWLYGSGYGLFTNIPLGDHVVTYIATDACGNTSSATMTVTVEDTSPPQAICSSNLQLSLSTSGVALLNAGTIGVNSSDNCGPVFLTASRDAENFTQQLLFNCSDIGQPVTVTLRVLDAVGLENFCETEVTVRDFLKPNIQCPPAVTLNCLQDPQNLTLTGQATATDNCALQSIIYQDIITLDACNIGAVNRVWKAIDATGNLKTCSQNIVLNAVNTTTVTFPPNRTLNDCANADAIHPDATGWPVLGGQACSPLSINYTDHIFSGTGPFCSRILRDWKVVDHCIYNPNGGSAGVWEQTQIIDIVDHTAPILELPADMTLPVDQPDCTAHVVLNDVLASDCNAQITISNDGLFAQASGANASGNYPMGEHLVTFTAVDGCGNSARQTLHITVSDQTPPQAVCQTGIVVNIGANGVATLDAKALDGGSTDACSPADSLHFSSNPAVFYCQHVGNQIVTLSVTDTAGNTGICATFVQVLDEAHVCTLGNPGYTISGAIRTPTGLPLHNIPVRLWSSQVNETLDCDTLGIYAFQDVPQGDTCHLRPANNANWLNGVTTFDLVLISKHILGITPLSSPFKMIAADANRSNSITTFDIVQLRKVLLGIFDTVPGNTSWRFLDSTFVFQDTLNPFTAPLPEEIVVNNLNVNQLGRNFTAIKIGDVNNSTDPANARSPQDTMLLYPASRAWRAGERLKVDLGLQGWATLEGLQFELDFDPEKVLLEGVDFPEPTLFNEKNMALPGENRLAVSWDHADGGKDVAAMMTLHLLGVESGNWETAVKLRRERLVPEGYLLDNEGVVAIELAGRSGQSGLPVSALEIFPNPTDGAFQVQNPLNAGAERLRILNSTGQVVWEQSGDFSNVISVSWNGFTPGIYLVELTGAGKTMSGKLVRL